MASQSGAKASLMMALGTEAPLWRSGQLADLFPDWPDERFALYALYPSRRSLPPKVHAFIDYCVENLPAG